MSARILCLNGGSSSLKFAVQAPDPGRGGGGEVRELEGAVEGIGGSSHARLRVRDSGGTPLCDQAVDVPDLGAAARRVLRGLTREGWAPRPDAAGHRVVHGGRDHLAPERVTPALLADLRACIPFAPLHLPGALDVIDAVAEALPDLPQVACFDTGFHRDLPERARRLALPRQLWDRGVRRYGFHGLSCEWVVEVLDPAPEARVVIAHLGHGASLTALRGRRPVDTSMGLTPAGGIMMSSRSGDLDPGVLVHLAETRGWGPRRLDELVNRESGLRGVSGTTGDMRALLEARAGDPRAALAVEMFCYQAAKQVGALAAALGGLDALVFTGGIGERAAPVRAEICGGLDHLGVRLDPARNAAHAEELSPPDAPCRVLRIPADEDRVIARHTRRLLAS